MSVYVDEATDYGGMVQGYARRHGTIWSHMFADSEEELIDFAKRLGLKEQWIQHRGTNRVHFDIIPRKRALAMKLGAKEMTLRDLFRLRRMGRAS